MADRLASGRCLLGVLTPSSNTALEPLTSQLLQQVDGVSAHFSRFSVTRISLGEDELKQFDLEPILQAASLLADAKVDMIGWSGTAAGWMGFEQDQTLCQQIEQRTGIPATSSILALNQVLARMAIKRIAIVSPYTSDVQQKIIENYQSIGISTVAERHLEISDNFAFSEVSPECLRQAVSEVAEAAPDAILLYCTNLRSADQVDQWEAELNIPIIDTTSTVIWKMLESMNFDCAEVRGWGRFFQEAK
ncbi:maleate cis-trans isomerase family protein [Agarivorans sp.]|uniref:maleate cis-trans isomerase family protein n=1 Tax=Agarivorans sp. TaxID=1872412 RepID=UPI003D05FF9A